MQLKCRHCTRGGSDTANCLFMTEMCEQLNENVTSGTTKKKHKVQSKFLVIKRFYVCIYQEAFICNKYGKMQQKVFGQSTMVLSMSMDMDAELGCIWSIFMK